MVDNEEKSEKTKTKKARGSPRSGASASSASSSTSPPPRGAPPAAAAGGTTGTSSFARMVQASSVVGDLSPASLPGQGSSSPVFGDLNLRAAEVTPVQGSSGSGTYRMTASSPGFGDLSPAATFPSSADITLGSPRAPSPGFGDLSPAATFPSSADRTLGSPRAPSPGFGDLSPAATFHSSADRTLGSPRAPSPVFGDLKRNSVPRFGSSEKPSVSWTNQPVSEDNHFLVDEVLSKLSTNSRKGSWSRVDEEQKNDQILKKRSTYGLNTTSAPARRSHVSLLELEKDGLSAASDEESEDSEITLVPPRTSVDYRRDLSFEGDDDSRDRSASSESAPNFGSSTVRASLSLNVVDNQVDLKRLPSYAFSSHAMDSGHSAAGGSAPPTPSATSARTVTGPPSSAPSLRKASTVLSAEERLHGHVLSGKSSPVATSISPHVYLDASRPGSLQDNTPTFVSMRSAPDSFPCIGGGDGKSPRGVADDDSFDGDDVPRFGVEPSAGGRSHDNESIRAIPIFGGQDSGATFSAPSSQTPKISLDQSSGKVFSQKSVGVFSDKSSSPNRLGTPMLRKKEESTKSQKQHQLQHGPQHMMDSLLEAASRQFLGDYSYPNEDDVEFGTNKFTGSYTFEPVPGQQQPPQPQPQNVGSPNLRQLLKSAGSPKSTVERRTQGEHERSSDRSSLLPEFGGGEAGESARIGGGAGDDVSMDTRIGGDPRIELVEEYLAFTDLDGMGTSGEMPRHVPASFPPTRATHGGSSAYTGTSIIITDPVVVSGHHEHSIRDFEDFTDDGFLTPSQYTGGVASTIDGRDMGYSRISQHMQMMQGHKNSVNNNTQYMSPFTGHSMGRIEDHFDAGMDGVVSRRPAPRDASPSYADLAGAEMMHYPMDLSLHREAQHQDEDMTAATEISGPILETKKPFIDRSSPWPLPRMGSFKASLMEMERELKSTKDELRELKQSRVGSSIPEAALIVAARQGWVPAEKVNADFERINKQMEVMANRLERTLKICKKDHVPRQESLDQVAYNEKRPSSSSFKQRPKERTSLPRRPAFTPMSRGSSKNKVSSSSESHSHSHSSHYTQSQSSHKERHKAHSGRIEGGAPASLEGVRQSSRQSGGAHTSSLPPKVAYTDRRSLHCGGSTLMDVEESPRLSVKIEERRGMSVGLALTKTTYAAETCADMGGTTINRFGSSISSGKNEANRRTSGPISLQQHLVIKRDNDMLRKAVVELEKQLKSRDEEIHRLQRASEKELSQQTQATCSSALSKGFLRQSIGCSSTDHGAGGQPRGGLRHASSQGTVGRTPRGFTLTRTKSKSDLRPHMIFSNSASPCRYSASYAKKGKATSASLAKHSLSSTSVLEEKNKKKSITTAPKATAAPKGEPEKRRSMNRKP